MCTALLVAVANAQMRTTISVDEANSGARWGSWRRGTMIPIATQDTADSSADSLQFAFASFGYSTDTYVPATGLGTQIGAYFPEVFLPVTVLGRDPYNGNKWNISWSALVPIGTAMVISVFHPQDVGPGVQKVLIYALLAPVLAANSQHHLVLVGPRGLVESDQFRLTAFVGCRTDCYTRDITWVRWTPMAGLQQGLNLTGESEMSSTKWLVLSGGIEAPVDFSSGVHSMPSLLFINLKYYFPIKTR